MTARAVAVALLLAACSRPAPPPTAVPQRIVSLAPSVTEMLFAVGAGARVVGVTRYCDYPPEAAALPRVGGYIDPSVEAVVALTPDLVITVRSPANQRPVQAMQRLGLRVEVVGEAMLADVRTALSTVGRLVGHEAQARRAVETLDASMAAVAAQVTTGPRPRTLLVYGHRPLVVASRRSYAGDLLDAAGGDNLVQANAAYPMWAIERVLSDAPDVIVDVTMAPAGEEDAAAFWSRWPSLPAVAKGRVHRLAAAGLMRPGPRAPQGAQALADLLRPRP